VRVDVAGAIVRVRVGVGERKTVLVRVMYMGRVDDGVKEAARVCVAVPVGRMVSVPVGLTVKVTVIETSKVCDAVSPGKLVNDNG
jgi:hypothetical protein